MRRVGVNECAPGGATVLLFRLPLGRKRSDAAARSAHADQWIATRTVQAEGRGYVAGDEQGVGGTRRAISCATREP